MSIVHWKRPRWNKPGRKRFFIVFDPFGRHRITVEFRMFTAVYDLNRVIVMLDQGTSNCSSSAWNIYFGSVSRQIWRGALDRFWAEVRTEEETEKILLGEFTRKKWHTTKCQHCIIYSATIVVIEYIGERKSKHHHAVVVLIFLILIYREKSKNMKKEKHIFDFPSIFMHDTVSVFFNMDLGYLW